MHAKAGYTGDLPTHCLTQDLVSFIDSESSA